MSWLVKLIYHVQKRLGGCKNAVPRRGYMYMRVSVTVDTGHMCSIKMSAQLQPSDKQMQLLERAIRRSTDAITWPKLSCISEHIFYVAEACLMQCGKCAKPNRCPQTVRQHQYRQKQISNTCVQEHTLSQSFRGWYNMWRKCKGTFQQKNVLTQSLGTCPPACPV